MEPIGNNGVEITGSKGPVPFYLLVTIIGVEPPAAPLPRCPAAPLPRCPAAPLPRFPLPASRFPLPASRAVNATPMRRKRNAYAPKRPHFSLFYFGMVFAIMLYVLPFNLEALCYLQRLCRFIVLKRM